MGVSIGVDIGQKRENTAIAAVVEERRGDGGGQKPEVHYLVPFLERLEPGASYPQIAERLKEVVEGIRRRPAPQNSVEQVYVDATGIGQPVIDLLELRGVRVVPVYFTFGDRRTVAEDRSFVTLGKAWLVSRLQVLLQTGRIHLPDTVEARRLAKELQDYEIRVEEDANDRYGAFRVGTQDDLVTALGLALQGRLPSSSSSTVAVHPFLGFAASPPPLRRRSAGW